MRRRKEAKASIETRELAYAFARMSVYRGDDEDKAKMLCDKKCKQMGIPDTERSEFVKMFNWWRRQIRADRERFGPNPDLG